MIPSANEREQGLIRSQLSRDPTELVDTHRPGSGAGRFKCALDEAGLVEPCANAWSQIGSPAVPRPDDRGATCAQLGHRSDDPRHVCVRDVPEYAADEYEVGRDGADVCVRDRRVAGDYVDRIEPRLLDTVTGSLGEVRVLLDEAGADSPAVRLSRDRAEQVTPVSRTDTDSTNLGAASCAQDVADSSSNDDESLGEGAARVFITAMPRGPVGPCHSTSVACKTHRAARPTLRSRIDRRPDLLDGSAASRPLTPASGSARPRPRPAFRLHSLERRALVHPLLLGRAQDSARVPLLCRLVGGQGSTPARGRLRGPRRRGRRRRNAGSGRRVVEAAHATTPGAPWSARLACQAP